MNIRHHLIACACAALVVAPGHAQTTSGRGANAPSTPSTTTSTGTDARPTQATRVSVIGCVQRTSATAADNTTTIVPAGETRYVLSNVTPAARDAVSGHRTAGTSGDVPSDAVTQYRLDDAADSMIAPHVGNRVEVSGTLTDEPVGTAGRAATATAPVGPMLKVEHIEKVSEGPATCRP